jgi:hypothetical protein
MCYGGPDGFDQTLVGQRLLRLDDEPRADSGTRIPFLLRAREPATKAWTDGLIGDQPIPVDFLSFDGRRGVAEFQLPGAIGAQSAKLPLGAKMRNATPPYP